MPEQSGGPTIALRPPGLTAFVVYLRPTARGPLLQALADLGVFVVEQQGGSQALQTVYGVRTDLVIVVGCDTAEHAAIAHALHQALASPLVALVPEAGTGEHYGAAEATVVISDDTPAGEFGRRLTPALRAARNVRRLGEAAAEYLVLRDVTFRVLPPELAREGQVVTLSLAEREVLEELAQAAGRPVGKSTLEQRLTRSSAGNRQRPAYLKVVIRRLRLKLENVGADASMLRTIRGFGYMLAS